MPVTVEQLPKQPIFVVTVTDPFNPLKEMPASTRQFQELIATVGGTVYRIVDVTRYNVQFNDLVNVLAIDARAASTDPRVRSVIVGSGEMVALGTKAMKQRQYGSVDAPMFASIDEALAFVNAELART